MTRLLAITLVVALAACGKSSADSAPVRTYPSRMGAPGERNVLTFAWDDTRGMIPRLVPALAGARVRIHAYYVDPRITYDARIVGNGATLAAVAEECACTYADVSTTVDAGVPCDEGSRRSCHPIVDVDLVDVGGPVLEILDHDVLVDRIALTIERATSLVLRMSTAARGLTPAGPVTLRQDEWLSVEAVVADARGESLFAGDALAFAVGDPQVLARSPTVTGPRRFVVDAARRGETSVTITARGLAASARVRVE